MRIFMMIAGLVLACCPALAGDALTAPARVFSVLDGDTVRVVAPGLDPLTPNPVIRVADLNTPEKALCMPGDTIMRACEPCAAGVALGLKAARQARALLPAGLPVRLAIISRDRYGRLVARITLPDGRDYAGAIRALGLGAPYPPGPRPRPWCGGAG